MILAMIRNLPEGSLFVALRQVEAEDEGIEREQMTQREEDLAEQKLWTTDRKLMAQLINAIHGLASITVRIHGGKDPEIPVVGPSEWDPKAQRKKELLKNWTNEDVLRALGWAGGTGLVRTL